MHEYYTFEDLIQSNECQSFWTTVRFGPFQKRLHQTFRYPSLDCPFWMWNNTTMSEAVAECLLPFTKYISLLINKLSFELAENHKFCFKAVSNVTANIAKCNATHINSTGISDWIFMYIFSWSSHLRRFTISQMWNMEKE